MYYRMGMQIFRDDEDPEYWKHDQDEEKPKYDDFDDFDDDRIDYNSEFGGVDLY